MTAQRRYQTPHPRPESATVIFDLLRAYRQTTRTELARRSGLSKATVSEVIGLLLEQGFIREIGKRQLGRGRSQIVIEFEPTTRLVLGAQLDDRVCTVVLADLAAHPRARAIRPIVGTHPEAFLDALCDCVDELRARAEAPILGLGVGAPGSVDPSGRTVLVSVPYGWKDVPIAALLEARLDLPVVAANRAKVAALGEFWQGEHPGIDHLVYVFVGEGIVAGLILNGALYFGSAGGAGELGHVTVLPDGPVCGCGNRGCLHMLAAESAILLRRVRTLAREAERRSLLAELTDGVLGRVSLDLLARAVDAGDGLALDVVAEAGTYLGLALANVINLINPQRVVLGGPVARLGEPLLEAVRREIRRRALGDALSRLAIVPSTLGDAAGAIGAAALFLESIETVGTILQANGLGGVAPPI